MNRSSDAPSVVVARLGPLCSAILLTTCFLSDAAEAKNPYIYVVRQERSGVHTSKSIPESVVMERYGPGFHTVDADTYDSLPGTTRNVWEHRVRYLSYVVVPFGYAGPKLSVVGTNVTVGVVEEYPWKALSSLGRQTVALQDLMAKTKPSKKGSAAMEQVTALAKDVLGSFRQCFSRPNTHWIPMEMAGFEARALDMRRQLNVFRHALEGFDYKPEVEWYHIRSDIKELASFVQSITSQKSEWCLFWDLPRGQPLKLMAGGNVLDQTTVKVDERPIAARDL